MSQGRDVYVSRGVGDTVEVSAVPAEKAHPVMTVVVPCDCWDPAIVGYVREFLDRVAPPSPLLTLVNSPRSAPKPGLVTRSQTSARPLALVR
jgi:hypothetical protein